MKISFKAFLVYLVFCIVPSVSQAMYSIKNSTENFNHQVGSLLVKINVLTNDGRGNGTGFFVRKNLIITNFHVIERAVLSNGRISLDNDNIYTSNVKVINFDIENDLALLWIHPRSQNSYLDILIQPNEDLSFGDYITSYGYPLGSNDPMYTDTHFGFAGLDYLHVKNTSTVLFDQLLPGMSGGPLFTEDGVFAGVNSAILEEDNRWSCNLRPTTGLIITAEKVKSFLSDSMQTPNMSLAKDSLYKASLETGSFVSN